MTIRTLQFKIYRYDPEKDQAPRMQDISVEVDSTDRCLRHLPDRFGHQVDVIALQSGVVVRAEQHPLAPERVIRGQRRTQPLIGHLPVQEPLADLLPLGHQRVVRPQCGVVVLLLP